MCKQLVASPFPQQFFQSLLKKCVVLISLSNREAPPPPAISIWPPPPPPLSFPFPRRLWSLKETVVGMHTGRERERSLAIAVRVENTSLPLKQPPLQPNPPSFYSNPVLHCDEGTKTWRELGPAGAKYRLWSGKRLRFHFVSLTLWASSCHVENDHCSGGKSMDNP